MLNVENVTQKYNLKEGELYYFIYFIAMLKM